jgi:hypothetical protein
MTLSISQRALSGLSVKEATNSNELSVLSAMVGSAKATGRHPNSGIATSRERALNPKEN